MWRDRDRARHHLLVASRRAPAASACGRALPLLRRGRARPGDREPLASVADVVEVVRAAFDEGGGELVLLQQRRLRRRGRRHRLPGALRRGHPPALRHAGRGAGASAARRPLDRPGVRPRRRRAQLQPRDLRPRRCSTATASAARATSAASATSTRSAYAARVFPSGTVWSDLVLGLEPLGIDHARGIDALGRTGRRPGRRRLDASASPSGDRADPPTTSRRVLAHLYRRVRARGINMRWVRDLAAGVAPLEARHPPATPRACASPSRGSRARASAALAPRGLARFRRRLRVRASATPSTRRTSDAVAPSPVRARACAGRRRRHPPAVAHPDRAHATGRRCCCSASAAFFAVRMMPRARRAPPAAQRALAVFVALPRLLGDERAAAHGDEPPRHGAPAADGRAVGQGHLRAVRQRGRVLHPRARSSSPPRS